MPHLGGLPSWKEYSNCTAHVAYYLFHTAIADKIIYQNHKLIPCTSEVWEFQGWEASLLAAIPVPRQRAEWQENKREQKWAKFTHDKPTLTTSPFLKPQLPMLSTLISIALEIIINYN